MFVIQVKVCRAPHHRSKGWIKQGAWANGLTEEAGFLLPSSAVVLHIPLIQCGQLRTSGHPSLQVLD